MASVTDVSTNVIVSDVSSSRMPLDVNPMVMIGC